MSAYDAQCVAVARAAGCNLWTGDESMMRAHAGRLPFVKWIGAYQGLDGN